MYCGNELMFSIEIFKNNTQDQVMDDENEEAIASYYSGNTIHSR